MQWKPTMTWQVAKQRATILEQIRRFFSTRDVVEVDTPLLCANTITDVHIDAIKASYDWAFHGSLDMYLQTSPEYAVKRLLASGYQSVYQICKAFRNEPEGRLHNPEFTMLEWYRLDYSMLDLINEVEDLLVEILDIEQVERITYQEAFIRHTGIDPLMTNRNELIDYVASNNKLATWLVDANDIDTLLQFIFCEFIEKNIGQNCPCFVYGFPASQASLATVCEQDQRIANRFECYFKGVELVNGFNELQDDKIQLKRFNTDNNKRLSLGLPPRPIDERFISALKQGLPSCSGVALGVDRLIMLALNKQTISEVITFPTSYA